MRRDLVPDHPPRIALPRMRRGIAPDYGLADLQRWLRRLPIRWRLTITFAAVMAALLAALIAFLYFHFRSDLDYNVNQSLRARAQDIAGLVRHENAAATRGALRRLPPNAANVVQVLSADGHVLAASAGLSQPSLLRPSELASATRSPRLIQRGESFRLYALPLAGGQKIVVAGVALAERDAALDKLDNNLAIGVPPALLLATLAAYFLAAAALRPVEKMRQRAATISTDELSTRLPLPASQDEIRRLGMTLNRMLDRLEEGLSHERLFVANASHELRMPLAVLRAELEVSLRERGGEQPLRAAIGSAIEETDRIVQLAEDLLLLARAEDGTLPIDPDDLPVEELLFELGARFTPIVHDAGRELRVAPDAIAAQVTVRADPARIQQAISNLIDNTLRYGAGEIILSARVAGSAIELHVGDRGAGFSDWLLPRAFDRFSRADPARERGGVGLGLAVVRMIAHAHGGDAGAANRPAGGADVWLSLPAVVQQPL
ncbi:MAG: HAMP domain-containing sensor histidine kinase [Solirubrobacteraceae bacterium]